MRKVFAVILVLVLAAGCVYAEDLASLKAKAEQGDAEAMDQIGLIYHYGDGVKRDYKEALKWYMKAAELGSLLLILRGVTEMPVSPVQEWATRCSCTQQLLA